MVSGSALSFLAVTRQLAHLLGGEVTVSSEVAKGSTFSLRIPAGVDVTKRPLPAGHSSTETLQQALAKSEQINFHGHCLVAEDASANQMLVKRMLVKAGVEVVVVRDGKEALQQVQTQLFDLIFMDIQMPRMNGFEATKAIRAAGLKTPIVALTANVMKGDEQKCLEAGCDAYLAKPIDRKAFIDTLQTYLSPTSETQALSTEESVDAINHEMNEPSMMCTDASRLDEQLAQSADMLNWPELTRRMDNDEDFIRDVIEAWRTNNPSSMVALAKAVKEGNTADIISWAHVMNSSASVISAHALAHAAFLLETAGREGQLGNTEMLLADMQAEFDKLEAFLSQSDWIEKGKVAHSEG
jgi:CheY-like chemotaxis protein/HPt (histidine-containing phosphotransfer) domain-containing protein